jgi:hypothetical protein
MRSELRYCKDIGLWAIDRPMTSCTHRTVYCRTNCYNHKLYAIYRGMKPKDKRNEAYWQALDGGQIREHLLRKSTGGKGVVKTRARLMTRGEAFSTPNDIRKVEDILARNPDTVWWIPTRAWRNEFYRPLVKRLSDQYPNAKILASLDPSNTAEEVAGLVDDGWSTMFFGDNGHTDQPNPVKCRKTWNHETGVCSTCTEGCFGAGQKHVWLKKH